MTTHPAFEAALAANDHQQLLSLYTTALAQRDRAEAIIRALLNPATSIQTIAKETSHATERDKSTDSSSFSTLHDRNSKPPTQRALTQKKSAPALKPNLADAI